MFFLFEIFRVALLFICQGSVCCRSSTQHCYVITTCLVCQQLFSLFFHCFFISFSAVDFHSNTTFFDCQLLFSFFPKCFFHSGNIIRQLQSRQPGASDYVNFSSEIQKTGNPVFYVIPLSEKRILFRHICQAEKEGFEPSRRSPDLYP